MSKNVGQSNYEQVLCNSNLASPNKKASSPLNSSILFQDYSNNSTVTSSPISATKIKNNKLIKKKIIPSNIITRAKHKIFQKAYAENKDRLDRFKILLNAKLKLKKLIHHYLAKTGLVKYRTVELACYQDIDETSVQLKYLKPNHLSQNDVESDNTVKYAGLSLVVQNIDSTPDSVPNPFIKLEEPELYFQLPDSLLEDHDIEQNSAELDISLNLELPQQDPKPLEYLAHTPQDYIISTQEKVNKVLLYKNHAQKDSRLFNQAGSFKTLIEQNSHRVALQQTNPDPALDDINKYLELYLLQNIQKDNKELLNKHDVILPKIFIQQFPIQFHNPESVVFLADYAGNTLSEYLKNDYILNFDNKLQHVRTITKIYLKILIAAYACNKAGYYVNDIKDNNIGINISGEIGIFDYSFSKQKSGITTLKFLPMSTLITNPIALEEVSAHQISNLTLVLFFSYCKFLAKYNNEDAWIKYKETVTLSQAFGVTKINNNDIWKEFVKDYLQQNEDFTETLANYIVNPTSVIDMPNIIISQLSKIANLDDKIT